jgi:hypothetical protein
MKASISVVRLLVRLARAVWIMAINEFLTNSAFAPDDIKSLGTQNQHAEAFDGGAGRRSWGSGQVRRAVSRIEIVRERVQIAFFD